MTPLNKFTRYNMFGWDVFKRTIPSGDIYQTTINASIPFASTGLQTLWVKGLISGVNTTTGEVTPSRVPGYFTDTAKVIPSGVYEFIAQEDAEWWCLPAHVNDNDAPVLTPVVIKEGESFTVPANSLVVFVAGSFIVDMEIFDTLPVPFELTENEMTVVALEDTYGLIFDRKK